jgi:ribosome maturation factor RimP
VAQKDLPYGKESSSRIEEALRERGLELCHVEWKPAHGRGVLALTIDRPALDVPEDPEDPDALALALEAPRPSWSGVTLEDCEVANRVVGAILDETDEIPGAYVLEVSSPGLDRQLFTIEDCRRFAGRRVKLSTRVPMEGSKNLKGILESVEGDVLTLFDEDRKRRYTTRFGDLKIARLVPDLLPPDAPGRPRMERPTK